MTEIQFIRKELKIAYKTGKSEHPVLLPLIHTIKEYQIPLKYPLELLKGVTMDIINNRYKNYHDLYNFCYRVAGIVGLMMTHILGYRTKEAFLYAEKLGVAMQLTNILRDIQEDMKINRIYIPQEEIKEFYVHEDDFFQEKVTPNFRRLIKFQVQRAHRYYEEADRGIPMLSKESQFAIYSASKIYRNILKKIEKHDYNPFLGRMYVPKIQKFGVIFSEFFRNRFRNLNTELRPA
jgi:phytoene synthase